MAPITNNKYELILRAIGQELDALHVEEFSLEVDGSNYVVRGPRKRCKTENAPTLSIFKKALLRSRNKSKPQATTRTSVGKHSSSVDSLTIRISQADIEQLELAGQALRSSSEGTPEVHSVSQILRTAGAYVDQKKGRLIRVFRRDPSVTLWYRDRSGFELKEVFTPLNLYDFWVHQYKQRSHLTRIRKTGTG